MLKEMRNKRNEKLRETETNLKAKIKKDKKRI